ncbi:MAG: hemerythrin family protein [Acidobacteriia bacterium]|nr:hemerythrin family protein [Terriglobia bacterium]
MRLFKWSKAEATFLDEIDAEHREIFRAAGELHEAILAGVAAPQVQEILKRLIAEFERHFRHEERLMRSVHYPIYDWHKRQHDTVRKRLRQFLPRIESGETGAAHLLLEFFAWWLKEHTRLTDCMMAAYVRNHERAMAVAS